MDDNSVKTLIVGVVFCLVHLLSLYVASYSGRVEPHFSSLCGGFAASFVFLELLPSIDDYHEVIGKRIYGFILIGFAAFYESLGRVDLTENHADEKPYGISGSKVREQLAGGERPDPRIMRPEIADILIDAYRSSG